MASPGLGEVGLGNNLDGIGLVRVQSGTQIDLGKASLAQQTTSQVAMQGVAVTIDSLSLFFDNDVFVVGVVAIVLGTSSGCGGRALRWASL